LKLLRPQLPRQLRQLTLLLRPLRLLLTQLLLLRRLLRPLRLLLTLLLLLRLLRSNQLCSIENRPSGRFFFVPAPEKTFRATLLA
jgi:hypothetical protein